MLSLGYLYFVIFFCLIRLDIKVSTPTRPINIRTMTISLLSLPKVGVRSRLEIDCKNKAVPSTFIPQAISKYMKANYNGHKTVKIERNRKGYELTLENGLEVDFDQFGGFLKLSD